MAHGEQAGRGWREFPPEHVADRGRDWYRGDCHVHSTASIAGTLTPGRLVAAARAMGLDFLATTEHNTADTHGAWRRHTDDALLVILGQEVTTRTGHWLALGIRPGQVVDWRYGVQDNIVNRRLDEVRRAGGLCVAAHPHAPYDSGTFLYPYRGFDAVEVWNGQWSSQLPWQADNETALAEWAHNLGAQVHKGRWLPAIGNSDTHLDGQIGIPHTVVLADELGVNAILAGIRAGRSWIAGSTAIELSFTVAAGDHRAGIGERLNIGDGPAMAQVDVHGVPSGRVSLHTDKGEVHGAFLSDQGSGTVRWPIGAAEPAFIRTEVRDHEGNMAALSNPIILA